MPPCCSSCWLTGSDVTTCGFRQDQFSSSIHRLLCSLVLSKHQPKVIWAWSKDRDAKSWNRICTPKSSLLQCRKALPPAGELTRWMNSSSEFKTCFASLQSAKHLLSFDKVPLVPSHISFNNISRNALQVRLRWQFSLPRCTYSIISLKTSAITQRANVAERMSAHEWDTPNSFSCYFPDWSLYSEYSTIVQQKSLQILPRLWQISFPECS